MRYIYHKRGHINQTFKYKISFNENKIHKYMQVESGENMIFLKYIFDFVFHWKGIYYGQLYYKTCLGILISPPKPQKTAKNVDF